MRAVSEFLFIIGNAPTAENALGQPPGYGPKTRRGPKRRLRLVLQAPASLSWRRSARRCNSAKGPNAENKKGLSWSRDYAKTHR